MFTAPEVKAAALTKFVCLTYDKGPRRTRSSDWQVRAV